MLRPRLCEKARPFFCAGMAGRHGGDVSYHSLYSLSLCSRHGYGSCEGYAGYGNCTGHRGCSDCCPWPIYTAGAAGELSRGGACCVVS